MDADRDLDNLYSGVNAHVFDNEKPTEGVKKAKEEQAQLRVELTPLAEAITAYLAEERRAIGDVRSYLSAKETKAEDILAEFRAREIYLTHLDRFETWVMNKLKQQQAKQTKK